MTTTTTAPLGLRAVFAALRADDEEHSLARVNAAHFAKMAERLFDDDLTTFANYKAIEARLLEAVGGCADRRSDAHRPRPGRAHRARGVPARRGRRLAFDVGDRGAR